MQLARQHRLNFASSDGSQEFPVATDRRAVGTSPRPARPRSTPLRASSVAPYQEIGLLSFARFHSQGEPIRFECISLQSVILLWAIRFTVPTNSFISASLRKDGLRN